MERILSWEVEASENGMRIGDYLRTKRCSHHVLTHLKQTECGICLNGTWAYAGQTIKEGDKVQIRIVEEGSSDSIVPVPLPFRVVYEDEDLMVINKPSDMPIHPSMGNFDNTLANAAAYYYAQQGRPFVYRCINRLARDTSGLLILAKHMYSGAVLSQMSAARQIHREYLAIVAGCLPASGTIDAPIARQEGSALMRCVDFANGEHAVTHFRRIRYFPDAHPGSLSGVCCIEKRPLQPVPEDASHPRHSLQNGLSLALVHLETGRTHQIRVHMKYIGHPLIGDFLYHPGSTSLISRQALHSHRLVFSHPVTGKTLAFQCEMPADMQNVLQRVSI